MKQWFFHLNGWMPYCTAAFALLGLWGQLSIAAAPAPVLQAVPQANGNVEIRFNSSELRRYTLEYRDTINNGSSWQAHPTFRNVPGTGEEIIFLDDSIIPDNVIRRFYRLRANIADVSFDMDKELVYYDFNNSSPAPSLSAENIIASDFSISTGNLLFASANSNTWTGSGVPYARGAANFTSTTVEGARSFTFTLSSDNQLPFILTNISFRVRATTAGPEVVSVVVNDTVITNYSIAANSTVLLDVPVTQLGNLNEATVRIAGWRDGSRDSSGLGDLHIDDVSVRGGLGINRSLMPPTLSAPTAETITEFSATLGGTIDSTGGSLIFERGIFWSTDPEVDIDDATPVSEFGDFEAGDFSLPVLNLPEDTTIYFRAFAVNGSGVGLSPISSFSTLENIELAYYSFDGNTFAAESSRATINASAMSLSAGTPSLSWTATQTAEWNALGAEDPYIQGSSWTASDPASARAFTFTLTADEGWLFTITNISLVARATDAGPTAIGGIVNGVLIYEQDMPGNQTIAVQMSVPDEGSLTDLSSADIRIPGWLNGSRSSSGGGSFRIDNILVQGFMSMGANTDDPEVGPVALTFTERHEAVFTSEIISNGGSTITERGIYWSTRPDFVPPLEAGKSSQSGTFGLGEFSASLDQLPANTTIYVRSFAATTGGSAYSDILSFQTPSHPSNLLAAYEFTSRKLSPHRRHPHLFASHFVSDTRRPSIQSPTEFGSRVPVAQINGDLSRASISTSRHFIHTLESMTGTTHTITNISFRARSRGTTGPSALSITLDGGSAIFTTNMPADTVIDVNVPITGQSNKTRSFIRIHGWNNGSRSTDGTGAFQIDDVVVTGSTSGSPAPRLTNGIPVRVATMNIKDSIGSPGQPQYEAVKRVIQRLDADIIAFQEIAVGDSANFAALGQSLGYPHSAISTGFDISATQRPAYLSKYPMTTAVVLSPGDAKEITRSIFRAEVQVPDANQPLVLWNLHLKAMNATIDQFRRAVETIRLMQDMQAYSLANPGNQAYVVLGDLNADFFAQPQRTSITSLPSGLPTTYSLGSDISFPIAYARFPDDRMKIGSLELQRAETAQADGFGMHTFQDFNFFSRLDYIYLSNVLATNNPLAEIYWSAVDGPYAGLPKSGAPLPSSLSETSSDHLPVFIDLYLPASSPSPQSQSVTGSNAHSEYDPTAHAETISITIDEIHSRPAGPTSDRIQILRTVALETRIEIEHLPDATVAIHFPTQSGVRYSIEYRDGFNADESWRLLQSYADIEGTGLRFTGIDPANPPPVSGIRFYRVRMD